MNNKTKREQQCSFCGKAPHEVEQLLAGPNAYICNECVEAGQLQLRMSRQGKPTGKHEPRLARPKEIDPPPSWVGCAPPCSWAG